jgi:hypothetical protein
MHTMLLSALLMTAPARADLDVAFVLDTTGSMSGELNEARQRVRQLGEALRAARPQEEVRLGVVAYRDRGDAYVTQVSGLSTDVETTFAFLAGLSAGGGGDGPEDVLSGLHAALTQLEWGEGAERQVFLIGDAPPHLDYAGHHDPVALLEMAREQEVVLNTIGCRSLSGSGIEFFRSMAYGSEGTYQHIGRVQAEDGGLADVVLDALASDAPADGPRETLAAWPERDRRQPPVGTLASQGLLVRLGTWWDTTEKAPDDGASCTVTVLLPDGVGLSEEPVFETSAGGYLHATLAPTPRPDVGPRARTFELARCLDVETPVRVAF